MHASEYTDKSDTDSGDGGVGRKAVIAASHTTRENDEDSVYTGYSNPIRVSRRLCSPTSITNVENSFLSPSLLFQEIVRLATPSFDLYYLYLSI